MSHEPEDKLVLNAIIHRDYLSPADIQIKIFDNSITFFNPGKLQQNLTVEDLKTNSYPAYARNKLIAEAFFLTGDIEKYGSGFLRIRRALSNYPTMALDCKEIAEGFMATVAYTKQKTSSVEQKDEGVNVTEKPTEKPTKKLSVDQIKILEVLAENQNTTSEELATILKIRADSVRDNLSKLKAKGMLERIGSAKGGYWKIISKKANK